MLSRVAENVFWMSRYVERAENIARVIDVTLQLQLDEPSNLDRQWAALVWVSGDYSAFEQLYPEANRQNVLNFLTFDRDNPNSILTALSAARENARSAREVISVEFWEEINDLFQQVKNDSSRNAARENPHEFFRGVRRAGHLLTGVAQETMTHDEAWHFIRMGRLLERADKTTRILDVKYFLLLPHAEAVGSPLDDLHWTAILRSASAFVPFRKTRERATVKPISEFLLLDRDFPRSVLHCLDSAGISLHAITGTPERRFRNAAEQRLGALVAELDYTDIDQVISAGLHEYLDGLQVKINDVGESVCEAFFGLPGR